MGILRTNACALRSLTHKDRHHGSPQGRRMLAQLSQAMLKVEQQPSVGLPRQVSKDPVVSWLLPATLALLGLSFSTFCTHQLVASADNRSLALSAEDQKRNSSGLPADSSSNNEPSKH
ncbi:hypothetical protein PoB_002681200 [Plakobranchus ocellatus]|uniref:Transmembrane protein n=1 Tax=Plakobranchus ocellatus TaxID=259542 RepID=A0AAV3ZZ41_9GAST|nr:hypothetical protein PoB_002681200 [Plakobranchus ocellatus]